MEMQNKTKREILHEEMAMIEVYECCAMAPFACIFSPIFGCPIVNCCRIAIMFCVETLAFWLN
jgi:hypothetical protein